ncbi:MAG: hypothetical protein IKT40_08145 [Bacilli bacterium]|nr:hypothetical protein [Bacilli bacterium]
MKNLTIYSAKRSFMIKDVVLMGRDYGSKEVTIINKNNNMIVINFHDYKVAHSFIEYVNNQHFAWDKENIDIDEAAFDLEINTILVRA